MNTKIENLKGEFFRQLYGAVKSQMPNGKAITSSNGDPQRVQLGTFDRLIGVIISAIVVGAIVWLGTAIENNRDATTDLQVEVAKQGEKLLSITQDRDLSLIYIDKRLERLERKLEDKSK